MDGWVVSIMPPARKTSGWHMPGHNYCGPFTDLGAKEKVLNKLDECCKTHDTEYSNKRIKTADSDAKLRECARKAGGVSGTLVDKIIGGKEIIDKYVYNTDKILRNDMSKGIATGSKRAQQSWKIKQHYEKKQALDTDSARVSTGKGQKRNRIEEPIGDAEMAEFAEGYDGQGFADDDESQQTSKRLKRSAGGAEGGTGTSGSGAGENVTVERPLGDPPRRYTKTFTNHLISYLDNGISNSSWKQHAGTKNKLPMVQWSEGWQLTGFGHIAAAMSANDWSVLTKTAKKFRVLSCSVTVDSLIPFQQSLVGTGLREATTTFSNRPQMAIYVDDGELLPNNTKNYKDCQHNDNWTLPYGTYTKTKLKHASFYFHGMDTTYWMNKTTELPNAAEPQKLFSLYKTGGVKTVYPGGAFSKTWKNTDSSWKSARLPNDNEDKIITKEGANEGEYQHNRTNWLGAHYTAGVAGRGNLFTTHNQVQSEQVQVNNYVDTGLEIQHRGPPFVLMKMENYYGNDDAPMQIYGQVHLHYSVTVEIEELENTNHFAQQWINHTKSTNTLALFDEICSEGVAGFPADNAVHRAYGPSENNAFFS